MNDAWQTKRLGDLVTVQNGYAFSSKDYSNSGHFVVRIGNVQNGNILLSDPKFIEVPSDSSLERFVLFEGDILVSLTGNVGRVGVIEKEHLPAVLNQRVARITINKSSPAIRELILLFLYSDRFRKELAGAGHGAAQQNVSTKDIVEIKIPVPPLPDQKRIVSVLDEAFAGIAIAKANAEKNLQNARALFASHLQSVFSQNGKGWVEKRLCEACDFSQGIQVDVKLQSENRIKANQVRFLRIVDYTQGSEPERYIDNPGDKFLVCRSDVSLVRYGASTGYVCKGLEGAIANNLFRVIPKRNYISNDYLYWFLKSPLFQDKIKKIMNGAAMPAISFGVISDIALPFPSLSEQQQVVSRLNTIVAEIQHLESIYQQKLSALDDLKKSLLHQAFSGQL